MKRPTVSVGVANYNHGHYLDGALRAILEQSVAPDEVIVLDDCSTDNSVQVIEKFASTHPTVKFVRNEQNRGVVWVANRLLSLASCDYFYCAAADDLVSPNFLEHSMRMLTAYPQAAFCSTISRVLDARTGRYLYWLP